MAKVEFNYKGTTTTILCTEDEKMEEICKRFSSKLQIDINKVYFLYSANKINLHLTFAQLINSTDESRKTISVLVNEINPDDSNKKSSLIKSNLPICPECLDNVIIEIVDFKIKSKECKNGQSIDLPFNEYENSQMIDISHIKCDQCKKNKYETYNNEMYICNECNINLCPLCKDNHDKKHNIFNYDNKNYICRKHNESFVSY